MNNKRRFAEGLVDQPEYVPASTVLKNRPYKKVPKTEIVFNEKSRRDFVTGFRKRKEHRKKRAQEQRKAMHKKEVLELRHTREEEWKSKNPKLHKRLTRMLGLENKEDDGDGGVDEQDIQEFLVDDKVVTTTITTVSFGDDVKLEEEDEEKEEGVEIKEEDGFGFDLLEAKKKNRRGGAGKHKTKRPKR